MSKSKDQHSSNAAEPSFEASLEEIQRIAAELEDGTLGLEESMLRYEQGIGLLRKCIVTLERAEQKIEILTRSCADGEVETAPFDASATIEKSSSSAGRRKQTKSQPGPTDREEQSDDDTEHGNTLFS